MDHLSNLPLEILVEITKFLSTKDILNFSISSQSLCDILHNIKFSDFVWFKNIHSLPYFDSFTDVAYDSNEPIFPKSLHTLYWMSTDALTHVPTTLQSLKLSPYYDHILPELPDSLTELNLGSKYNQLLPQLLDSLTHLILSDDYNHQLISLPATLLHLELGWSYDKKLPLLPNSLRYLQLGFSFNEIFSKLPDSLEEFVLGNGYNQPLPLLPNSLKYLEFGDYFDVQNLPRSLPPSLRVSKYCDCHFCDDGSKYKWWLHFYPKFYELQWHAKST